MGKIRKRFFLNIKILFLLLYVYLSDLLLADDCTNTRHLIEEKKQFFLRPDHTLYIKINLLVVYFFKNIYLKKGLVNSKFIC